jgi:hypothetical protein
VDVPVQKAGTPKNIRLVARDDIKSTIGSGGSAKAVKFTQRASVPPGGEWRDDHTATDGETLRNLLCGKGESLRDGLARSSTVSSRRSQSA